MNILRITLLIILLVPLLVYYIYNRIGRFLKYYHKYSKKYTILLTSIFILIMLSLTTTFSIICLFLLISALLLDGIYIIIMRLTKRNIIKSSLYKNGTLVILIAMLLTGYGYWNANTIQEKSYHLTTEKALSKDTITILQISDLHFGVTLNTSNLKEKIEKINKRSSDLVVLTGDIFDENTTKKEMEEASKLLGRLKSNYGIYYILGNHDPNHYARSKKYTEKEMLTTLRENQITPLVDETIVIEDEIYIIGRKDFSLGKRKSLEELTEGVDFSKYVILLDHQPLEFTEARNLKIDLQLSGHTHAGQIWPLGLFMDLAKIYQKSYGKYQSQGYTAIVSSGMGSWNYPIRTSKSTEYVVINIKTMAKGK